MLIAAVDLQGPMGSVKVKGLNGRSSSVNWKKSGHWKTQKLLPRTRSTEACPGHKVQQWCLRNCLGSKQDQGIWGSVCACKKEKIQEKLCRKGCGYGTEDVLEAQLYYRGYWRQNEDTACYCFFFPLFSGKDISVLYICKKTLFLIAKSLQGHICKITTQWCREHSSPSPHRQRR